MSDRDKLIELIKESVGGCATYWASLIADHLIANGVTILPDCKGCQYEKRKRPQKCSCCSRNIDMKDCYTQDYDRHWTEYPPKGE